MKFFEVVPRTSIDFLRYASVFSIASAVVIGALFVLWLVRGFNLSIEFRGGTSLQFELPEAKPEMDTADVRSAMSEIGYPDAAVVTFGGEAQTYMVTLDISEELAAQRESDASEAKPAEPKPEAAAKPEEAKPDATAAAAPPAPDAAKPETAEAAAAAPAAAPPAASPEAEAAQNTLAGRILSNLERQLGTKVVVQSIESVGPRVGGELTRSGFLALFITSVGILLYVAARFDSLYAPGAVIALFHDVSITAGLFVLFQWEFDLQVLAALLVVLGYSINDTIVIYDRIREIAEVRGTSHFRDLVNQALNETLSRTILTSFTVLLVVLSLLFFGGPVLRPLALALTIGVISGTYSTVYIASALLVYLQEYRAGRQGKGTGKGSGKSKGSNPALRAQHV
jgi:preprotein translocase subunit SecF